MINNKDRQIKYAIIKNITGDVAIARRARSWSWKRLNDVFKIRKPKTEVQIKRKYAKSTQSKKRTLYKKYIALIDRNYKPSEAKELAKKSVKTNPKTVQKKPIKESYINNIDRVIVGDRSRALREAQWSQWGKDSNDAGGNMYPTEIARTALELNLKRGFDNNDGYGWKVLYLAYIEQIPLSEAIDRTQLDPWDQSDIYRYLAKV